jgi:hypothetical protein
LINFSLHYDKQLSALSVGIASADFDLLSLANKLAVIMIEENKNARLASIDKDGNPLSEIVLSTIARRKRANKGNGPPLIPDYMKSRLIDTAEPEINLISDDHIQIILHWPGAEPWLKYHKTECKTRNGIPFKSGQPRPVRDIVGMDKGWIEKIRQEAIKEIQSSAASGSPAHAGLPNGLIEELI